jgi:kynurenine formamidase
MPTYDCSQPVESGMPVYPGDDPVRVEENCTVPEDGSNIREIRCTTHTGTHVDAPSHKVADGPTLSEFDVSSFAFEARVVDCTPCAERERLTTGVLPPGLPEGEADGTPEMVLFHTGWSEHWGTERYRDSPYLDAGLAAWCAERGLHVGVDTFSPDPVPSADPDREGGDEPTDQPAHAALCGADRLIVENLRGLGRLPERVRLAAYPLAVVDGDGSPVRAIAHAAER